MAKTIYNSRYQKIINELMKERVRLGISQGELATQIFLNQSDISKIEKFERRLDILELSMILRALRIHANPRLQGIFGEFFGFKHD